MTLMSSGCDRAEFALKRFRLHGFDEMPCESGKLGLLAIFGEAIAGQRNQPQRATIWKSADAPCEFVAVHSPGQADIDERHVERAIGGELQQRERVLAVRRFAHIVTMRAQHRAIHFARIVIVIHQQYASRLEGAAG